MTVFWWVLEALLAMVIGAVIVVGVSFLALFVIYGIRVRLATRDAEKTRKRMGTR